MDLSDRDTKSTYTFGKIKSGGRGIKLNCNTSYYPHTIKQTERSKKILQNIMGKYVIEKEKNPIIGKNLCI